MRILTAALLAAIAAIPAPAQSRRGVDPSILDYETNLLVPEIPEKQKSAIRHHLNSIEDALAHLKYKTERHRDKETVTLVVPCSELFAPNDTVLKASAAQKLEHLVKFLRYPTMYKIVVGVFTDNTGEEEYRDALSQARAGAIDQYLVGLARSKGYHDVNITAYGMGDTMPRAENSSIENRAKNRRVEIHIIPEWQMIDTARSGKL